MNAESRRPTCIALALARTLAMLITLGGCAITSQIDSAPKTYDLPEGKTPRLRGQQSIALKNAYGTETKVIVAQQSRNTFEADLKQYTDTAITMIERQLKKDGISIDPTAAKAITVRVRDMTFKLRIIPFGAIANGSLTLEAELGDGTKTAFRSDSETSSYSNSGNALDAAVLLAVTSLLNDQQFLAYMNRP
jgi:hypothetical protein